MPNAAITGWGSYTPEKRVTNEELSKTLDTSDKWIRARTGISERRVVGEHESTSTMCTQASLRALECAGLDANDIDLIICSTTTPDYLVPATGCLLQEQVGAFRAGVLDVNCACTGFVISLITATQFIKAGTAQRILVVAGETLTRFVDWNDRNTCVLFGDGAGAVIVEATSRVCGVRGMDMGCYGDRERWLSIPAGGATMPASPQTITDGKHYVHMHGSEVFKLAVRNMAKSATHSLGRAELELKQIRKVIPHQANLRIIQSLQDHLQLPDEQVFVNIARYGNTGAASVPIALVDLLNEETIDVGEQLLLVAFGGGLSWASTVVQWADVAAIHGERRLPRGLAKSA